MTDEPAEGGRKNWETHTKYPYPTPSEDEKRAWAAVQRIKRYAYLAISRSLLPETKIGKGNAVVPIWRVTWCRKRIAWGKDELKVRVMSDFSKAFLGDCAICGSVHTCPVCAYTIGRKKGHELIQAVERKKCGEAFLVVTAQHKRETSLHQLYKIIAGGVDYMYSGGPAARFRKKWKIKGIVSGWDYTCSLKNGHHPHKNNQVLSELPSLDLPEFREDFGRLAERYKKYLGDHGLFTNDHTIKILTDKQDCSQYMTKWALSLEVSQTAQKEGHEGHFTQWQLLGEIGFGDIPKDVRADYVTLFREFAYGSKGKRQLRYSNGLRAWLGLGQEKTDEELAQEGTEQPWFDFTSLSYEQFRPVLAAEKTGSIGRMLEAAREYAQDSDLAGFYDWYDLEYKRVNPWDAPQDPQESLQSAESA